MATGFKLQRLSMSAPIVTAAGYATQQLVQWWNAICTTLEGTITSIEAQQAQIDTILGISTSATSAAAQAQASAEYAQQQAAGVLTPIPNGDVLANTSGATSKPVGTPLTTVIDTAIGATQGDILYRGATAWVVLGPGTAGQKLTTAGAGANPYWS